MRIKIALMVLVFASGAWAKDLFLLVGQSNMAGRGDLGGACVSTERIEKLDKNDQWVEAIEPIHYDKPSAGAGLAATFARTLADRDRAVEIGLIPCAVGGSGLNEWMPGAKLYVEAMRRAKIAQKDGEIKAILWHQGESDADQGNLQATYNERLAKMAESMRKELGLDAAKAPFIYGAIGEFLSAPYYEGNKALNAEMRKAVDIIPNARWVEADDLTCKGDLIHFDTGSVRTLGERYAQAYLKFTKGAFFTLRNVYSDHMLFQQGEPIILAGTATAGAEVAVAMGGAKATAKVGSDGKWRAELPSKKAGGPYEIKIACGKDELVLKDVLIGELWLCGGQSNMEMPVWGANPAYRCPEGDKEADAANDPELRLFNVERAVCPDGPRENATGNSGWKRADTPEAVKPFSATGYFFGKRLRKKLGVPVGLVGSNWGGTQIEPWISEKTLRERKMTKEVEELESTREYQPFVNGKAVLPKVLAARLKELNLWLQKVEAAGGDAGEWLRKNGALTNVSDKDWNWKNPSLVVPTPQFVWYRWHFSVQGGGDEFKIDENAGDKALQLNDNEAPLPAKVEGLRFEADWISDTDIAFFDGKRIGETDASVRYYWAQKRRYAIPTPKEGQHVLCVRCLNHWGDGGIKNPQLVWNTGSIDLAKAPFCTKVEAVVDHAKTGGRPITPWGEGDTAYQANPRGRNTVPSTLFNAMIAPLDVFRFRGAIWYQGCANTGKWQKYASDQEALVASWRETFRRPDMAFICVELAGFQNHQPGNPFTDEQIAAFPPQENGYVFIRPEQEKIRAVPGCDCASAVDIGNPSDIHPKDKPEVGRRLCAMAENLCYGGKHAARGPKAVKVTRDGAAVEVTFDGPIIVKGGAFGPHEFTLAGKDSKRVWAEAKLVKPDTVRVESAVVAEPLRVDYAWAPFVPKMSVFNKAGFPATPFKLDVKE